MAHGLERLTLLRGDITRIQADAVVNAANSSLLGGGGVDGAIHRAAGPDLKAECRTLGGCAVGEAKVTRGYRLPARFVIHTVGPVWCGSDQHEGELLARCYRSCLRLAAEHGLRSLAFPSISTGAYGFPVTRAAPIALREVRAGLLEDKSLRVSVVLFSDADLRHYRAAYEQLVQEQLVREQNQEAT